MQIRSLAPSLAGIALLLSACSGGTSYTDTAPTAAPARETVVASAPINVAVMPLSVKASNGFTADATLKQSLWRKLQVAVAQNPALNTAALPDSPEAKAVIEKTMAYAAGVLPAEEFKKVPAFQNVEKFLYGATSVTKAQTEKLVGMKVVKSVVYHADVFLRLVDSKTLQYQAAVGQGEASTPEAAIAAAIQKAVMQYALQ